MPKPADRIAAQWSLSEFLNHIDLRSQTWCFVSLGASGGFSVPHNDDIAFYAVLEGQARLAGAGGDRVVLEEGQMVFLLSGEAHALRASAQAPAPIHDFLAVNEYVDEPGAFVFGREPAATRLLCGRIKVRWPSGQQPAALPPVLTAGSSGMVDLRRLTRAARGPGAAAILTRFANLLFVESFRQSADCHAVFRDSALHDPIARARHYIEVHPFNPWTVEILARKVGMGRANFAARFAAQVGRTPIDALTGERMRHAADFLTDTDLKVAEIAERVGYRSEAAFSRRFAAHFGLAPGAMRRQRRDGTLAAD